MTSTDELTEIEKKVQLESPLKEMPLLMSNYIKASTQCKKLNAETQQKWEKLNAAKDSIAVEDAMLITLTERVEDKRAKLIRLCEMCDETLVNAEPRKQQYVIELKKLDEMRDSLNEKRKAMQEFLSNATVRLTQLKESLRNVNSNTNSLEEVLNFEEGCQSIIMSQVEVKVEEFKLKTTAELEQKRETKAAREKLFFQRVKAAEAAQVQEIIALEDALKKKEEKIAATTEKYLKLKESPNSHARSASLGGSSRKSTSSSRSRSRKRAASQSSKTALSSAAPVPAPSIANSNTQNAPSSASITELERQSRLNSHIFNEGLIREIKSVSAESLLKSDVGLLFRDIAYSYSGDSPFPSALNSPKKQSAKSESISDKPAASKENFIKEVGTFSELSVSKFSTLSAMSNVSTDTLLFEEMYKRGVSSPSELPVSVLEKCQKAKAMQKEQTEGQRNLVEPVGDSDVESLFPDITYSTDSPFPSALNSPKRQSAKSEPISDKPAASKENFIKQDEGAVSKFGVSATSNVNPDALIFEEMRRHGVVSPSELPQSVFDKCKEAKSMEKQQTKRDLDEDSISKYSILSEMSDLSTDTLLFEEMQRHGVVSPSELPKSVLEKCEQAKAMKKEKAGPDKQGNAVKEKMKSHFKYRRERELGLARKKSIDAMDNNEFAFGTANGVSFSDDFSSPHRISTCFSKRSDVMENVSPNDMLIEDDNISVSSTTIERLEIARDIEFSASAKTGGSSNQPKRSRRRL